MWITPRGGAGKKGEKAREIRLYCERNHHFANINTEMRTFLPHLRTLITILIWGRGSRLTLMAVSPVGAIVGHAGNGFRADIPYRRYPRADAICNKISTIHNIYRCFWSAVCYS